MRKLIFLTTLIGILLNGYSQEENWFSIHKEQANQYFNHKNNPAEYYDLLNDFKGIIQQGENVGKALTKRVFGYFPYWAGSNYLNYQWNLLSDLCYFSYEVDPATGNPITIYDWSTSPAIDSALANNVKVHLCVTLFSGHAAFFSSETAQQTLITNIISLIQQRGAQGVNIDFEAVPSAWGNALTNFMIALSSQMHTTLPGSEVSIAAPAVNWSGTFNIPVMHQYIDFFMVMGYDYYWNGSTQAGPVSPLYSMTGNYDYNFSKTVSYYQEQGTPSHKLIMGVPYYARQWPTQGQFPPSATTGSGTAYTYRFIKINSSGNYSPANRYTEPNSLSTYYSYNNNGWYQCFLDEFYSLGKKYDLVNRRNLAGIGIWALGYDDGFSDLWDLIASKFSDWKLPVETDTLYDSGGPAFSYYNNESYLYTISVPPQKNIHLEFDYLDLEPGYDSIWIFDGADTSALLIGGYTGNVGPGAIYSASNQLTLKFQSDAGITAQGWKAIYQAIPPSGVNENSPVGWEFGLSVYPNPFNHAARICYQIEKKSPVKVHIYDFTGRQIHLIEQGLVEEGAHCIELSSDAMLAGIYFCSLEVNGIKVGIKKLTVLR